MAPGPAAPGPAAPGPAKPGAKPDRAWGERWYVLRDRLLGNPGFQRWAARFPLTRPIARRRAYRLFDLVAGFVYSQVLLACVRLRLLERLAESPRTAEQLAPALGLDLAATRRLLAAAESLRLVAARRDERFGLGDLGAALLANPGVLAMIEHHPLLYEDLRDPVRLLREGGGGGALQRYWGYARSGAPDELPAERVADYSALMAASQSFTAAEILDAYPLGRHRRLLDLGGGEGAFVAAAAARHPELQFILFDLPAVAERARDRLAAAGIGGRVRAVGGNFFGDPLPPGADVISLVRILHDHDDEPALRLLRTARLALPKGGTLLVAEPMAGMKDGAPIGGAYFGFYLLAMGSGRPRSEAEICGLLRQAGFAAVRAIPARGALFTRLIEARA